MQDHSLTVKSCMGLRGNSARMLAVHSYLVFTLLGLRIFSTACSDYGYCKLNVSDKISVGDICHFLHCTLERSRCESNNWSRFKMGSRRIQNQLKNYKLRQSLSLSHCPLITETAIVILCVRTGLLGSWEQIYEVWTACTESNETQHQLYVSFTRPEKPSTSSLWLQQSIVAPEVSVFFNCNISGCCLSLGGLQLDVFYHWNSWKDKVNTPQNGKGGLFFVQQICKCIFRDKKILRIILVPLSRLTKSSP